LKACGLVKSKSEQESDTNTPLKAIKRIAHSEDCEKALSDFIADVLTHHSNRFIRNYRIRHWTHTTLQETPPASAAPEPHPAVSAPLSDAPCVLGYVRPEQAGFVRRKGRFYFYAVDKKTNATRNYDSPVFHAKFFIGHNRQKTLPWFAEVKSVKLESADHIAKLTGRDPSQVGAIFYYLMELGEPGQAQGRATEGWPEGHPVGEGNRSGDCQRQPLWWEKSGSERVNIRSGGSPCGLPLAVFFRCAPILSSFLKIRSAVSQSETPGDVGARSHDAGFLRIIVTNQPDVERRKKPNPGMLVDAAAKLGVDLANLLAEVRGRDGRVFLVGSGGGTGHASHAVCDFRKLGGIQAIRPTDNISELTARINDEGWEACSSGQAGAGKASLCRRRAEM